MVIDKRKQKPHGLELVLVVLLITDIKYLKHNNCVSGLMRVSRFYFERNMKTICKVIKFCFSSYSNNTL